MKKEVLKLLKDHQQTYFSGAKISEKLGVSRTAIWKVINKLKKEGYTIESVSSKGYRLIEDKEIVNQEEIDLIIDENNLFSKGIYLETVGSTNDYLKKVSVEYADENIMVISDEQVKGKGRLGRHWASKAGEGLYMSYLLRTHLRPEKMAIMTQIVAASIVKTFEALSDVSVGIKWPNDIIVNHKKICGILTELDAELNRVHYIILGIGVNLHQKEFPEELEKKATSYYLETGKRLSRKAFIEEFLTVFTRYYTLFVEKGDLQEVLRVCTEYSVLMEKKVRLIQGNKAREVFVKGLNDQGQLVVKNEKNEEEVIFFGEISIRGIDNEYI